MRFAESCLENETLRLGESEKPGELVEEELLNNIYLSFARYLAELGLGGGCVGKNEHAGATIPAKLYCDKAGQPYRRLMERSDTVAF